VTEGENMVDLTFVNLFRHGEHGDTEITEEIIFVFLRVSVLSVLSVSKEFAFSSRAMATQGCLVRYT
jgi:hypothetical protein